MAKSYLSDYSPTPASNTDIDGVDSTGATGRVKDGDNYTRSVMSHLAKFYDDLGAVNTVGGTATAITVTAAEGWTAYGSSANQIDTGTILAIKTGSAATGAATLNVNGIGAKAIRGQGDVAIQANDWIAGAILILRYDASFNGAAGAWVLANTILTLTPFTRTLLDDVDAAAARTTLGAEGALAAGTVAQYYRGDKTWQTLDKAAVGLGNVDNTADAAKSVSYADSAGAVDWSGVTSKPYTPSQNVNADQWPAFEGLTITTDGLFVTGGGFSCAGVYSDTTASAANVNINSGGVFRRSTSSIKYKKDVETLLPKFRDAVLELRPVWYRSKSKADNPSWGYYGFIAEEVALIDPRLVQWRTHADPTPVLDQKGNLTYDEFGHVVTEMLPLAKPEPEGVQYDRLVPHLVALVKELRDRIEVLEAAGP